MANFSLSNGQLSLINKSNLNFNLQGWSLISDRKVIHVFTKNELIKAQENFILDSLKYEGVRHFSLDDSFYLEDRESGYLHLLQNE